MKALMSIVHEDTDITHGVTSEHIERKCANLEYSRKTRHHLEAKKWKNAPPIKPQTFGKDRSTCEDWQVPSSMSLSNITLETPVLSLGVRFFDVCQRILEAGYVQRRVIAREMTVYVDMYVSHDNVDHGEISS